MGLRRGKKSKKQDAPLPAPGLPMPQGGLPPLPMPPGGSPLPPLPGAAPLPSAPLPPLPAAEPMPAPTPTMPAAPLPTPDPIVNDPSTTLSGLADEKGYNDLWAKRSDKPLPQIYGHIDRIANKEAGSLLDRYADRFGHALDREIIVMRKAELDDKVAEVRDAPVVELIEDESSAPDTLEGELLQVEAELRSLKPLYKEAKSIGDSATLAELTPTLQSLMAQRKALKQTIESSGTEAQVASVATSSSDNDDLFVQFVSIVDDLLGDHLPEAIVNAFVESDDFEIYKDVLAGPATTDDDTRSIFYNMVDDQLGNMPEESINAFTETSDFAIYLAISNQYKEA